MKKTLSVLLTILAINCLSQNLTTVSPNSALRGQGLGVTISGTNLHFTQATSTAVWFSQGSSTIMYPTNIQVVNNQTLSTYFQINSSQPTGVYNLHVSNSIDGSLTLPNSFTVLYNSTQPQIISVNPNVASKNQTLNVVISGLNTNFAQGTGTITWFQQGSSTIYPNNQTANTATNLIANYSIPSNAPSGYYDTYAYNTTDGLMQLFSSFYINLQESISEIFEEENIEIYPNPTAINFYLNLKKYSGAEYSIQMYNIAGVKVLSKNDISQFPHLINVENLENGVYFIEIIENNKRIAVKKVLVNR